MGRWLIALVLCLLNSCGTGKNPAKDIIGIEVVTTSQDKILPGQEVVIKEGAISLGGTYVFKMIIRASGTANLTISKIVFEHQPCEEEIKTGGPGPGLTLNDKGLNYPLEIAPPGKGDEVIPEQINVSIQFKRNGITCERKGVLHIYNNDSDTAKRDFIVKFRVESATPKIIASPALVDLGHVLKGSVGSSFFTISNVGTGELIISSVSYQGREGFTFVWQCANGSVSFQTAPDQIKKVESNTSCVMPVVLQGNTSMEVPVKYEAETDEKPAKAYLTFYTNDPSFNLAKGEGLGVELRANVGGPCLQASPSVVDFGSVLTNKKAVQAVQLTNCGDQHVNIKSVKIADNSSPYFSLDLKGLGDFSETKPLVLPPAGSKTFLVIFLPEKVMKDENGKAIPEVGKVIVDNDTPYSKLEIPLSGVGVDASCPVACFQVKDQKTGTIIPDKGEVEPQTKLQMVDCSSDDTPGGVIAGYKWKVVGPPLSADTFWPNNIYKSPEIQVNVVGCYEFHLKVTNSLGIESCNEAVQTVCVKAGKGCRVELLWDTPADPDQTDQCGVPPNGSPCSCGTDMDLHFVHPNGVGQGDIDGDGKPDGFFDSKWDCFYFNPHPCWNMMKCDDPLSQPNLDLDDTDGAGPENLNYPIPEKGVCYKVGVHYYHDHCIPGGSYPTVRVYIDGVKKYEKTAPKMKMLDMWIVGEVCCSNPEQPVKVYEKGGAPVIIPQYPSPY